MIVSSRNKAIKKKNREAKSSVAQSAVSLWFQKVEKIMIFCAICNVLSLRSCECMEQYERTSHVDICHLFQGRSICFVFRAFGLWFSHFAISIVLQLGLVRIACNILIHQDHR